MGKSKKELEQDVLDDDNEDDCFGNYLASDEACQECVDAEKSKKGKEEPKIKESKVAKKEEKKETEVKAKSTKTKAKAESKITYPTINGAISPFKEGTTAFIVFKTIVDKKKATLDRIIGAIEKSGLKCSDPANRAKKVANVLVTASYAGIKPKTFIKSESKGKISYEYVG